MAWPIPQKKKMKKRGQKLIILHLAYLQCVLTEICQ